ncbi:hypothetical protein ACH5RR_018779 [Cinchona calisaya]|uniref:Uncharacterized protein n=1 Tax=Cinchona calisaya TaxID=153742 RepID=A0ABD2ZQK6_9GENT
MNMVESQGIGEEFEDKVKENSETPVMFNLLGPPRRLATTDMEERVKQPKTAASLSAGPRIPLSTASSGGAASSLKSQSNDAVLPIFLHLHLRL